MIMVIGWVEGLPACVTGGSTQMCKTSLWHRQTDGHTTKKTSCLLVLRWRWEPARGLPQTRLLGGAAAAAFHDRAGAAVRRGQHSLCAGTREVAETPWTAPPLCRTTVFLRCQPDTDCGDLSNTSAPVQWGGWNSPQTPHRIPDPFPALTHGGSAGSATTGPIGASCPGRRLLSRLGSRGFGAEEGRRSLSPPTAVIPVNAGWARLSFIRSCPPVMADRSSTGLRLPGAVEHRKEGALSALSSPARNEMITLYSQRDDM